MEKLTLIYLELSLGGPESGEEVHLDLGLAAQRLLQLRLLVLGRGQRHLQLLGVTVGVALTQTLHLLREINQVLNQSINQSINR